MKITMTELSKKLMVGITITVFVLATIWVQGFYYLATPLAIASALALVIYFWPFIIQKLNLNEGNDENVVMEEEKEECKDEKPTNELQNNSVEPKAWTKIKLLAEAEQALDNGNVDEAEKLYLEAQRLQKEIEDEIEAEKLAEEQLAKEIAAKKEKATELRVLIAQARNK